MAFGPTPVSDDDRRALLDLVGGWHPGEPLETREDGWDHTNVVVGRRLVYRFPRAEWSRARIAGEAGLLAEFAPRSPVPVPAAEYRTEPFPHSRYAWIEGEPLGDPAKVSPSQAPHPMTGWSDAERDAAAAALGGFLSALHAFPVERAQELGIPAQGWPETWERNVGNLRDAFAHLDPADRALAERLLVRSKHVIEDAPVAVLHNDLSPEHILIDPETRAVTGIIDFGDAEIGDPALDFQWAWWLGDAFLARVLAHYRGDTGENFDLRWRIYRSFFLLSALRHRLERGDETDARRCATDFVAFARAAVAFC